jgi:hypothetical protein
MRQVSALPVAYQLIVAKNILFEVSAQFPHAILAPNKEGASFEFQQPCDY